MNAFLALLRKDLVLHFSNRRAVLMSLVAPILIAAFFGSLFGGSDKGPAQIPVVVTDLDQSEISARIVANLRGDPALRLSEASAAEAQAQVRAGKQRAAVLLPAGFGAQATRALIPAGLTDEQVVWRRHQARGGGVLRSLPGDGSAHGQGAAGPACDAAGQPIGFQQWQPGGARAAHADAAGR